MNLDGVLMCLLQIQVNVYNTVQLLAGILEGYG